MGDRQPAHADVELLEAELGFLRVIALAQTRWREITAAIAAGDPLPLEDLTPDQEKAVLNLQLRRLSPQERERVRANIAAVEAALRRLRAGRTVQGFYAGQSTRADPLREAPAAAPPDAHWFAVAPHSGTVFSPGRTPTAAAQHGDPEPDLHAVRLMNDYAADWPLWPASNGAAHEIKDLLDEELANRLRRWAQVFNAHYDHVNGWDNPAIAAEHRTEANRLLAALRKALPSPWTVTLDYWETNGANDDDPGSRRASRPNRSDTP